MLDEHTITEIGQLRLDNLAAKYLYQKQIARLNRLNKFVDVLALGAIKVTVIANLMAVIPTQRLTCGGFYHQ